MRLFEILHTTYETWTTPKILRLARSPWNAASAIIHALFGGTQTAFWIGDAAKPSATGAGLNINLSPGLGIFYYTSTDEFTSPFNPLLITWNTSIPFDANNDASGNDRIDVLAIIPIQPEGDPDPTAETTDPATLIKTTKTLNQWRERGYEWTIVKGAVSAVPSAPAVPPGYIGVAEVRIQNGAGVILDDDITDIRPSAAAKFADLNATQLTAEKIVSYGESVVACGTWSYDGAAALGVGGNCTIEHARGVTQITAEAGADSLVSVSFDPDNRPRSANFIVIPSMSSKAAADAAGFVRWRILDNTGFFLQYYDAAGALAAWPVDALQKFSFIVIDVTSL